MTLESYLEQKKQEIEKIKTQLEHKRKTIPDNFIKFNEIIGLPEHPVTLEPTPLMPFQTEFFDYIDKCKYHKFHVNKSRQIGFTELVLRILAFRSFNKYRGARVKIIAGTREQTAKKIMQRFHYLFNNIPDEVADKNDKLLVLKNGTEIEALPSNSEAIRGDTKVKAIFLDEAAHFNLVDDSVVMDAIGPLVDTNKTDLFMISTPNGPRGFFYNIDISQNDFFKPKFPIHVAKGWLYDEAQIATMLSRTDIDVEQEYLNQYTTGRNSIFGNKFNQGEHELSW